jgi:hypothetical protein
MGFCGTDMFSEIISEVIAAGYLFVLTRFPDANRRPSRVRGRPSLENTLSIIDGLIGQGPEIH